MSLILSEKARKYFRDLGSRKMNEPSMERWSLSLHTHIKDVKDDILKENLMEMKSQHTDAWEPHIELIENELKRRQLELTSII